MRVKKLTEKEFLQQVRDYARLMGWREYHCHDSRKSTPGFLDCLFLRDTRIVVAELKVGEGKLTVDQQEWLDAFGKAGVETCVFRPEDWSDIVRVLGRE